MAQSILTAEQAFTAGLDMVKAAGLPASGKDIPVLAAYRVFIRKSRGLETDDRFATDGPLYAKKLILTAYAHAPTPAMKLLLDGPGSNSPEAMAAEIVLSHIEPEGV